MTHPRLAHPSRTLLAPLAFALTISAAGCKREEIRAYRAPKAAPSTLMGAPSNPATPSTQASATPSATSGVAGEKVSWTLPSTWKEVPTTQQMRLATFDANGVEVSVAAFPGDVGGPLANINRWRGQIGLAPVTDAELPTLLTTTRENGVEVSLVTMAGSTGQVLLAASILPGDDKTWFVKATSEPAKIDAIRESFIAFAKSFRLGTPAASSAAPSAAQPATTPQATTTQPSPPKTPTAPGNAIAQRLGSTPPPPNWKPDANASTFLAASFTATNAKGTARATASSLLNDGGGLLNNLNRWREQLALAPLAAVAEQPVRNLSANAILVDLVNAANSDRQAIIVLTDTSGAQTTTWFFKLRGAPDAVAAELSTFETWAKAMGGIQ
jgi:hypothetical protein